MGVVWMVEAVTAVMGAVTAHQEADAERRVAPKLGRFRKPPPEHRQCKPEHRQCIPPRFYGVDFDQLHYTC